MAERRMLSKKIFQSRPFLMMPFEAQALYTHLILSSDDDGVVEAFPIVRMIGANEDSLGLLVIKKFILPLNDDMVYFVTDFEEQNKIRADRVQPSRYRDLLLEKTNLVIDGKRVTSKRKYIDGQVTDKCLTSDGQVTDKCPHSIGKDSIGKDSIGKDSIGKDNNTSISPSLAENLKTSGIRINEKQHQQLLEYVGIDGMSFDMLNRAIEITSGVHQPSFNYLKAILEKWKESGFTSLEQVDEHEEERRSSKNSASKTRFVGNAIEHEYQGELPF
nr:MAG TPA: replisome organizer protein [Caudoviricetes sp.]